MNKGFKILIGLIFLFSLIFIVVFYYYINPEETNLGFTCSFKEFTGLNCPGCGGQRAFHFLLHGEFWKALQYNIFIYFIPLFIYLLYVIIEVYLFKNKKFQQGFIFSNQFGKIVLIVIILYTILRNIPCKPFIFLSPPK